MGPLRGVIPPIITPFDSSGGIDRQALVELVEWYVDAGCDGLWVCGGTGEGISLTTDEKARMAEWTLEAVAGRMRVAFHVGAATTADAIRTTRDCQRLGVDAISSVPPFFYGKSDAEVLEYFRRLADETDRPVYLYNLPDATGRPLTVPLVEGIARCVPGVVGIKHSGTNMDLVVELLRALPTFEVIIGRGELTLAALVLGGVGVVCASLCMAPERFVALHQAFRDGDLRRAMEAQRHATRTKELFMDFPVIGATKCVNSAQIGRDCGLPRGPLAGVCGDDASRLLDQARRLEVLRADEHPAATVAAAPGRPR